MKKRRILLGLALAASAVFSLAACGEDEKTIPTETIVDNGSGNNGEGQTAQYTIKFMNGATEVKTEVLNEGATISAPANPTKPSTAEFRYEFAGWFTEAIGGNQVTNFGNADQDKTFYAHFTEIAIKYNVVFLNGETIVDQKELDYGTAINAPANPTKAEDEIGTYEFDGWYTDPTAGEKVTDFGTVSGAKTYYARFNTIYKQYNIVFIDGEDVVETKSLKYNEAIIAPSAPSKTGMMFLGWFTEVTGGDKVTDFGTVSGAKTYYARYDEIKEFENIGFGTSYTAFTALLTESGATRIDGKGRRNVASEDNETVTLNGYTFKGKAVIEGTSLNTQGSSVVINITDNNNEINLTASWGSGDKGVVKVFKDGNDTPIYTSSEYASKDSVSLALKNLDAGSYEIKAMKSSDASGASLVISQTYYKKAVRYVNVNYVLNNGEAKEADSIKAGTKLQSLPQLVYSGFEFDGWYTTATFEAGSEFNISDEINDDVTLYAKWHELTPDEIATVTFGSNLDTVTFESIQVKKGTTIQLPKTEVDGYRLEGWYTDNNFTTAFNNAAINGDIELFAKYVKTFNVTFLNKDGNVIKTVTVDDGTKVLETVKAPYVTGMVFDHWEIDGSTDIYEINEDVITSNLVVKAYYKEDTNPVEKISITSATGAYEAAIVEFAKYANADSYKIFLDGNGETDRELDSNNVYIQTNSNKVRADIIGIKAGNYDVRVVPVIDDTEAMAASTTATVAVTEYDRSGYAHFNNTEGVGAYNDDGTLKDNAIVLYVTDENKNTVELTYKGKTVKGIGNILNSVGQACGEAGHETECKKVSDGKTYYGKGNTNQGILLDLAQDNIPLVVRFVGIVSNSGLYQPGTYNADSVGKIEGLTGYNSVDCGGSVDDNGHMARMKSAKNLTLEGVGEEATIDGWGFHLICETAHTDLAKNFEVRNLRFINTPEDAIGMEGQETESTLTITASVERCWIHHNTFIAPHITSPAESDKSEGDGSCDFKRGRYFTCSYNYFEECHKTNLVGSSKTSVQYNMSYHHNIWYNCAARQPLARRGNIHFYNNLVIGTTDTVSSLRADAYMYAEGNYYMGCSRVVEYKAEGTAGTCKSYNNNLVGCFNAYDASVVTDREATVTSNCKDNATGISYANFDTNSELFYYDSVNKKSDCYLTDANQARLDCLAQAGSRFRTASDGAKLKISTDVTSVASTATISGQDSLTIPKGKNVLKVFTVTAPVTLTIAATSAAGFDAGYLLKMNGELVTNITSQDKTVVLENGVYVIASSVSFTGNGGKNDKETTVTKCEFAPYDSAELNQKLINNYNAAVDKIPANIQFTDECYNAIKNAIELYNSLGKLQSEVSYTKVEEAYEAYKQAGVLIVEELISQIGTVDQNSGTAISSARTTYNKLINRCKDANVSNYQTLVNAETAFESYAVEGCIQAINAIGTVTLDSEDAILAAESIYASLNEDQQKQITNYQTLVNARKEFDDLKAVKNVDDLISTAKTLTEFEAAETAYNALSATLKQKINATNLGLMYKDYTIALIDSLPETVTRANSATVEKARALYNALSSDNQALVTNYQTLVNAETALNDLPSTLVTKTLTESDFNVTGPSTFNVGTVYIGSSIVAISKVSYSQASKIVLNATRDDAAVNFVVSVSTDGTNWTVVGTKQPGSNNKAADLEYTITATGDYYIKIEVTCSKGTEEKPKHGKINSIKVTCYE